MIPRRKRADRHRSPRLRARPAGSRPAPPTRRRRPASSALTKSIARFAGPHGITANCVNPGVIDTPMIAAWPPEVRDRTVGATPLGRMGTPEEVAAVVVLARLGRSSVRPRRPHGRQRRPATWTSSERPAEGGRTMGKEAKVCRGTWCMAFGFDPRGDAGAGRARAVGVRATTASSSAGSSTTARSSASRTRRAAQKLKKWITDDLGPRDRRHRARPLR